MPSASLLPAFLTRRAALRLSIALLAALALLAAPLASPSPASHHGERAQAEDAMLEDINAERRDRGLPALRRDDDLRQLARDWSRNMASNGMRHRPSFWNHYPSGWTSAGENVGYNPLRNTLANTTEIMHGRFMDSSVHRSNILKGEFTHAGVGIHVSGDTAWYTVNFLGDPSRAASEPAPDAGAYADADAGTTPEPEDDGGDVAGEVVGGFLDVTTDSVHADAIVRMTDEGVIEGFADGTFRESASLTRGQLATLLVRQLGLEADGDAPTFSDVADGHPHAASVAAAASHDLVGGYEDGTFRPETALDRAQTATILVRAFDVDDASDGGAFSDVRGDHPYHEAIAAAAEGGLMSGYSDGTFRPDDRLTRGQIATILDRQL
jgi:uncharacterized protein YkwD